jgi:hypothetical protein
MDADYVKAARSQVKVLRNVAAATLKVLADLDDRLAEELNPQPEEAQGNDDSSSERGRRGYERERAAGAAAVREHHSAFEHLARH